MRLGSAVRLVNEYAGVFEHIELFLAEYFLESTVHCGHHKDAFVLLSQQTELLLVGEKQLVELTVEENDPHLVPPEVFR